MKRIITIEFIYDPSDRIITTAITLITEAIHFVYKGIVTSRNDFSESHFKYTDQELNK